VTKIRVGDILYPNDNNISERTEAFNWVVVEVEDNVRNTVHYHKFYNDGRIHICSLRSDYVFYNFDVINPKSVQFKKQLDEL
jgi:hypothetical protein